MLATWMFIHVGGSKKKEDFVGCYSRFGLNDICVQCWWEKAQFAQFDQQWLLHL